MSAENRRWVVHSRAGDPARIVWAPNAVEAYQEALTEVPIDQFGVVVEAYPADEPATDANTYMCRATLVLGRMGRHRDAALMDQLAMEALGLPSMAGKDFRLESQD